MEEWKPVVGYEGIYEVSNKGSVQRCDKYHKKTKPLSPARTKTGYLRVALCKGGICNTYSIHTLVSLAFNGPRPCNMEINHIDGNKENNCVDNLEYISHKENMLHALNVIDVIKNTRAKGKDCGRHTKPESYPFGETHPSSKLTEELVLKAMLLLRESNLEQREIAKIIGISQTQIWRIKTGQTWKHLTVK